MHFRVLLNHHNSKEGGKPRSPLGTRSIDFAKKDEVVGIEVGRDDDLLGRGGSYDEKLLPRCRANNMSVRRLKTRLCDSQLGLLKFFAVNV